MNQSPRPFVKKHGASFYRRWVTIQFIQGDDLIISLGKFGVMLEKTNHSFFSKKNTLLHIDNINAIAAYLSVVSQVQDDLAPPYLNDPPLRALANEALYAGSAEVYTNRLRSWITEYIQRSK